MSHGAELLGEARRVIIRAGLVFVLPRPQSQPASGADGAAPPPPLPQPLASRFRSERGLRSLKDAVYASLAKRFVMPGATQVGGSRRVAAPSPRIILQLLKILFNRESDGHGSDSAADGAPFVPFRESRRGPSRPYFLPLARLRNVVLWSALEEAEEE